MSKKNFYERVMKVQQELKAPKGQYNSFGKYSYRSCEDILEALKPHLVQEGLLLHMSDTLEYIGERYYVKAVVTIIDTESDATLTTTGYSREEENKKGMDGSQITGTSSSYARKHALNAMFLIDDQKDSDHSNTYNKAETQQNKQGAASKPKEDKSHGGEHLSDFTVTWEMLTQDQKDYFANKYPGPYGSQKNPKYFKKEEKEKIMQYLREKGIVE